MPDFLIQALDPIWQDGDRTDFVGLARGLCERSLLTARSDRTFLLHRLSLELERRRTPRPERFSWDSRVAEVLSTVVPKETADVRNWPRLVLLQPHASDLFMRTEPLVPATAFPAGDSRFASHLSTLLNQFGLFLRARAEFSAAEPLMRRALETDERSYGPEHPRVAIDLNNLARLLMETDRLNEAESLMRRALEIAEESHRPEHPNVATSLNNLARLLRITNRFQDAEPLMRRAIAIDERSFGPDHPNVARDLCNLAHLLHTTNRLQEAEPLIRRALEIYEQSYGPEHPQVAIRLNSLARLLQATRCINEAEPLSRRALAIFLDVTGRTGHPHPHLDTALENYAAILRALGRSEADIQAELGALQVQYKGDTGLKP